MAETRATNPLIEQFRRGGVPRDLRLMAAQGLLPLKPEDVVELWVDLLGDPDEGIRDAARRSLVDFHAAGSSDPEEPQRRPTSSRGRSRTGRSATARGHATEHLAARRDDRGAGALAVADWPSWSTSTGRAAAADIATRRARDEPGLRNDRADACASCATSASASSRRRRRRRPRLPAPAPGRTERGGRRA